MVWYSTYDFIDIEECFMKIVVIGGGKGGTGKITIATNLAAIRSIKGIDTLLVNNDPQASGSS